MLGLTRGFRCGVMTARYHSGMRPKQSRSKKYKHCATDRRSGRNPARNKKPCSALDLEKQYEELCRLREQVQIAESRQRLLLRYSDDVGG
jgi:hypothetical protein